VYVSPVLVTLCLMMQEDKVSMQKELQTWRNEAALWQSRLTNEQHATSMNSEMRNQCSSIQDEIDKKQARLSLLRRQILVNEAALDELIRLVTEVA
jgi:Microtubule-binding protein MIP-T3 C-terminal region